MVKRFSYLCDFAGTKHPVTFYIGDAAKGSNPIGFQSVWLSKNKGGVVPKDLMESLSNLKEIADTQKVSFEDLCEYVIKEIEFSKPTIKTNRKVNQVNHSSQAAQQNNQKITTNHDKNSSEEIINI